MLLLTHLFYSLPYFLFFMVYGLQFTLNLTKLKILILLSDFY